MILNVLFVRTLREAGAWAGGHTEAGGGDSEGADVLLGLEQDDVDLRSEQAAQHHRAAQADGDAHGGGLNLEEGRGFTRSVAGPHPDEEEEEARVFIN